MKKILIITLLSVTCSSICEAQIKKDLQQQQQKQQQTEQKQQEQQPAKQEQPEQQPAKKQETKPQQPAKQPQPKPQQPKPTEAKSEAKKEETEIERINRIRKENAEREERQRREEQERLLQLREMKKNSMELYATFDKPTLFGDKIQDKGNANTKFDYINDTPSGKGTALLLRKGGTLGKNYIGWTGFERYTHFTVSFWIKDFGTGLIFDTNNSTYLRNSDPANASGIVPYFFCTSDGYFKLVDRGNSNNATMGDVVPLKDGKWHLITVVLQNLGYNVNVSSTPVTCKLYVDGKIAATHVSKTEGWRNFDTFGFGGVCSISSFKIDNASDMKLDNIRIYSRALSAGEVEAIYREEQNPEILAKEGREKQEEKIIQVAEEITDNNGNDDNSNDEASFTDIGVEINGVTWATRNVAEAGTFAAQPESAGKMFQFGRNPCPSGWRVPTKAELKSLIKANSTWATRNGVNGRLFGSGSNTVFLPAVHNAGTYGNYWGSTDVFFTGGSVSCLDFSEHGVSTSDKVQSARLCVRCVAK